MGITGGGLDLENAFLNGQKRDIEGSSAKIEDEHVTLALRLLVKTVSNSRSGRLVDDTKDVKSCDGTSILRSETLRIVEVRWDAGLKLVCVSG